MDMPKPGDAHKRLEALVGEWSGSETVHPAPWDPVGGTATGEVVNSWILDGFAVMQQYAQIRNGTRNFSGHGVFWYDPTADEYGMTWWDTMGGSASHFRGRFDGNRLVLVSDMPQGGFCRSIFDIGTPGRYQFRMEVSPDGEQWSPAMEGTYRKSGKVRVGKRRAAAKQSARKSPGKTGSRPKASAKKAPAKKARVRRLKTAARSRRS